MFPGRETPWSILEVDAATATQRDVKRAYAKLLKKFRPDSDPEGFRRIHDAYETVVRELELRESGGVPVPPEPLLKERLPDSDPTSPAPEASPAPDLPSPFLAAAATLREAKTTGNRRPVPDALTQLRLVCGEDPALWLAWSKMLTEIFDEGLAEGGLVLFIDTNDVLRELRAGSMAVAEQMLNHWHREKKVGAMITAGKALTAKGAVPEFDHPAAGFFALRLAFRLAIAQPGGANLLLDAAFAWLPAQARSPLLPAVENRLNIGRLFWHLPPNWQPYWEHIFDELDDSKTIDWESKEARNSLADLMRVTPPDWPGWGFFQSVLPPAQWEGLVHFYQQRPPTRRRWSPPSKGWFTPPPDVPPGAGGDGIALRGPVPGSKSSRRQTEEDLWKLDDIDTVPFRMPGEPKGPPPSRPISEAEREPVPEKRRSHAPPRRGGLRQLWRHTRTTNKIAFGCIVLPIALGIFIRLTGSLVTSMLRERPVVSETTGRVPESVFLKGIESILDRSPRLKIELENFLLADRAGRLEIIGSAGQAGENNDLRMRLLVCAILHPKVPLDIKLMAVDKIEQVAPAQRALEMLKEANVPGAPVRPGIIIAMHRIFKDHQSELPEDVRLEFKMMDADWQRQDSRLR